MIVLPTDMNLRPIIGAVKQKSLELMLFGLGTTVGLGDSLRQQNNLSMVEYVTNGLYVVLPAMIVAYGVSGNLEGAINRIGSPLYVGHLVGQTVGEFIKINYL
ncbi:MAG: hypothetical protein IH949_13545 [Bacteroidetes bacterium]|nr:hypothetical protein [Bacteroidota bacterium]